MSAPVTTPTEQPSLSTPTVGFLRLQKLEAPPSSHSSISPSRETPFDYMPNIQKKCRIKLPPTPYVAPEAQSVALPPIARPLLKQPTALPNQRPFTLALPSPNRTYALEQPSPGRSEAIRFVQYALSRNNAPQQGSPSEPEIPGYCSSASASQQDSPGEPEVPAFCFSNEWTNKAIPFIEQRFLISQFRELRERSKTPSEEPFRASAATVIRWQEETQAVYTRITLDPNFGDLSQLNSYAEDVIRKMQTMIVLQNYKSDTILSLRVLLLEERLEEKYTLHAYVRDYAARKDLKSDKRSRLLSEEGIPRAVACYLGDPDYLGYPKRDEDIVQRDADTVQAAVIHFFQSHKKREVASDASH